MRWHWLVFFLILTSLPACNRENHASFEGYVEGENLYLAAPYFGVLEKLFVHRGQQVEKGTMLFSLDPNPQRIAIAQIQAELAQAQNTLLDLQKPRRQPEITAIEAQIEQTDAQIALASLRASRLQKLYERQATDKDSVDAANALLQQQQKLKAQYIANLALAKLGSREDQIKAQQSAVDSLGEKLRNAEWELEQKTVTAPASGVIFDRYFQPGELVGAQQPVVSLLTPENIRIEFFVPLSYLAQVKVGQEITFDCDGCEKNNKAVISYISPDAEFVPPLVYSRDNSNKLIFRIKASINNPLQFKPGQPVTVSL